MNIKGLARAERVELAELVTGLSAEQWDAPSLCATWRVRDVAAHVHAYGQLTPARFAAHVARGELLEDINRIGVATYADHPSWQLADLLRAHSEPTGLTAWFGGRVALVEAMIHQQDIRRALDLPRTIPEDRLRIALDFTRYAPLIRGAWRTRGVRLAATDFTWVHGSGPLVNGPGEALLMAMAGRAASLADLSGPGSTKLSTRITF
ncbi:maleylpyruvate isomerase family mycothiol-dependent enzyme [Nocardia sp. NPDC004654]|uniref:maleylpyruvate isomerase family mycothiol-dependent enzyme n=1 Tax=Nocardia sp. NPDC004654 TaxID=3154776 RepID=UPI0033A697C7